MKRQELLEQNLMDALITQNYDVMDRILSLVFNPFNIDKKEYDTDAFMLAIEFNDLKAIDIIFKNFKKNFEPRNIADPSKYTTKLIDADSEEIFDIIKKYDFLDAFKDKLSLGNSILSISPNCTKMVLNEMTQSLEDSQGTLNILMHRILMMDSYNAFLDENYHQRFKNLLTVLSEENHELLEQSIIGTLILVQKHKYNHNIIKSDYKENYNELVYSLIEIGLDPFKKIKEYDIEVPSTLKEFLDDNPEVLEMNFFDSIAFEDTKIYVEKKFLDSKLSPKQKLLNELSQEVKHHHKI